MLQQLGIEKITIPLPFKLDHVHCFLIEDLHGGYTIIDTGLHYDVTKAIWEKQLAGKKVNRIILTHLHPDHTGYAGVLQQLTGASVYMTKTDARALEEVWHHRSMNRLMKDYNVFGVPKSLQAQITQLMQDTTESVRPLPKVDAYLEDNDSIQLGAYEYEVVTTPGHSEGLVCFYQKDTKTLLSTDHILPHITPNISYWFYGEDNPLLSYKQSLRKMSNYDIKYGIPSHGEEMINPLERAEEIWQHHEERLHFILGHLNEGKTAFEICELLFPKQLSTHEYQFAIGEAVAHLEYLRVSEHCQREQINGVYYYEIK